MQDWKFKLIIKINDILFTRELYGDHKKRAYYKGLPITTDEYAWFDVDVRECYIEALELITKSRLSQLDLVDIFKTLDGSAKHFKEINISSFIPDKIKYGHADFEWIKQESIKFYQQTIDNKRVEILELYQKLKNDFLIPISDTQPTNTIEFDNNILLNIMNDDMIDLFLQNEQRLKADGYITSENKWINGRGKNQTKTLKDLANLILLLKEKKYLKLKFNRKLLQEKDYKKFFEARYGCNLKEQFIEANKCTIKSLETAKTTFSYF